MLGLNADVRRARNDSASCLVTHLQVLTQHALSWLWQRDALLMHELSQRQNVLVLLISAGSASRDVARLVQESAVTHRKLQFAATSWSIPPLNVGTVSHIIIVNVESTNGSSSGRS